jgi:hypothetical protein
MFLMALAIQKVPPHINLDLHPLHDELLAQFVAIPADDDASDHASVPQEAHL